MFFSVQKSSFFLLVIFAAFQLPGIRGVTSLFAQEPKPDAKKEAAAAEKRAKSLETMKSHIRYGSLNIRIEGIKKIESLKPEEKPEFVSLITEYATEDLDPVVRRECLRVLGEVGDSSTDPVLQKALSDKNFDVRDEAVRSLGKRDYRASADELFELTKKEDLTGDDRFLLSLIDVLSRFEYTPAAPFFEAKIKEKETHPDVRSKLILYFGRAGADSSSPYLLELAKNEDERPTDRAYAVNSLGKLKYAPALSPFQTMLRDITDMSPGREKNDLIPLKMHLIAALVLLGNSSVRPMILAATRDESAGVRLRAVRQMGELRMKENRDVLEYKVKFDENPRVRKEAQKSLDLIDGKTSEESNTDETEEL